MSRIASFYLFCALCSAPSAMAQAQSYLIDSNLDLLFSVDLATGAATQIASTNNNGLGTPADLTWKADTQELWTIDLGGGAVGTIDTTTGTFTPLYQTALSGWQGMAWDPITAMFYLANQNGNSYVLDPVSGVTTLLGASGYSLLTCLDVDSTGTLYGIDFFNRNVVSIDKVTGVGTTLSQTLAGFQGLGIDDATGIWYGADTNSDSLYIIDPNTGVTTLVGAHGAGVQFAKGFDLAGTNGVRARGTGCSDSTGAIFRLTATGSPALGQSLTVSGTFVAVAPYWIIVGLSDQNWSGIALPLDLGLFGGTGCSLYTSEEAVLGPLPQGSGLTFTIPNLTSLVGNQSFLQGFLVDGAISRPLPIATSNYLEVTIQA